MDTIDIILEAPYMGPIGASPPPAEPPAEPPPEPPPAGPMPPPRDRKVGEELADRLAAIFAHKSAVEREGFTLLRRFVQEGWWGDQNMRTPGAWLSWRLGIDYSTAAEWLRVAEKLGTLALIDAAYRKGQLSYTQVKHLTRVATPECEAALLEQAPYLTGAQLQKVCRDIRLQLAACEQADVSELIRLAFKQHDDGTVTLEARMRSEQAAVVERAVELRMQEKRDAAPAEPRVPSTAAERRAERVNSLVEICERYTDGVGKHETNVRSDVLALVKIDLETLQGTRPVPVDTCCLGDDTPIPVETARRLLCDSTVVPALLKKKGGKPLDVGRRTRTIPSGLRLLLLDRDQGRCQFPGCGARGYLDAHHIEHWSQGGETRLENLVLLCRGRHHQSVHEGGYQVLVADDGSLVFLDPQGRVVPRGPTFPELDEGAVERLKEGHRAAGIEIDAETNLCRHNFDRGTDYGGIVRMALDRMPGTRWFRPSLAFDAWEVPPEERRRLARGASWFKGLPEEVQRRVG